MTQHVSRRDVQDDLTIALAALAVLSIGAGLE